ncbi:helix-turn-helix domain-containing protein [Salinisphaera japonica]|uniref:XRE family transcriptional regulator n=1 Tax=Salinisphaera japonica YTM-1 TaxID=1209778 RepID=A0A423PGX0_9GAMM|nr:XRE family transcriptional regulator [Salinisphaera japonica]ROO24861.1 XRE family transcriptional regulator [Salinisphaera japonica YTM-1]
MFNPARLTIARERRQVTKKALAQGAGISNVTLTRIETGETAQPEQETIAALATTLNYPKAFFFGDDLETLQTKSVSFRSLSSMTAKQRKAALAAGALAYSIDDWVQRKFDLPQSEVLGLRGEDPATAAITVRSAWGVGYQPVRHMIKLLESKGVRLFSLEESNHNVDAFSVWRGDKPYVFLNTLKSAERSRFDAAHELGHLVLHQHGLLDDLGENEKRDREREADQFASAFLMPKEDLHARLPKFPSLQQIVKAKTRWGVSVAALARSSYDAGVISNWQYRALCRQLSTLGYRRKEPNSQNREYSIAWDKVLRELWLEGFTKDDLAAELNLPVDEVESLLQTAPPSKQDEVAQSRSTRYSRPGLRLVRDNA